VLTSLIKADSQVAHADDGVRVLLTQHALPQLQHLPVHGLSSYNRQAAPEGLFQGSHSCNQG
jgi:hypothetical protein